jgi:four helix bundle protein
MKTRTRRYSVNPQTNPIPGRLLAYDLALEAATQVYQLVGKVPPSAGSLADQARRAASSVPLNLAEASGRAGRDRLQHHRIAHGSAKEATASVQLLRAIQAVDSAQATETLALLDRVNAITYRLARPKG